MISADQILAWAPVAFFVLSLLLFGLVGVLAWQKGSGTAALAVLVAAAICGSFSFLDHLSEIDATATSLKVKVREASDAVAGLRKLAAMTGRALIGVEAESGAVGGAPPAFRDQLKQDVLETLHEIGVDDRTISDVRDVSKLQDAKAYVSAIERHTNNCFDMELSTSFSWTSDFLRQSSPDPEKIKELIAKYHANDYFNEKALREYEYYLRTGVPQDVAFWHNRGSWPLGDAILPDGKRDCGK